MGYKVGQIVKLKDDRVAEILGDDVSGYKVRLDGEEQIIPAKDIDRVAGPISVVMDDLSHNVLEVLSNSVNFAIIQKVRGRPFFKSGRLMSFAVSDAAYETLAKAYIEPYLMGFIKMSVARIADDRFIQAGDFQDALKAVPVAILQGIYGKMFQRKGWTSDFMRNMVEGYIAMVLANIDTRLIQKWIAPEKPSRY